MIQYPGPQSSGLGQVVAPNDLKNLLKAQNHVGGLLYMAGRMPALPHLLQPQTRMIRGRVQRVSLTAHADVESCYREELESIFCWEIFDPSRRPELESYPA
ncbi:uncharacterized protein EDB91DRAFT_1248428 [Suillus paluster]|uniref:uncharacterized protein n=1 Tax=Suillus paluster TaxID=48578 RepID=UPI001B879078|nr:uncharacterized protein EDB91DRAFT_1248428 [Suillus paluster]KAG1740551.1 hypothetical protein EDB91DRAFT_1248428 [Suillus paluster]